MAQELRNVSTTSAVQVFTGMFSGKQAHDERALFVSSSEEAAISAVEKDIYRSLRD